MVGPAVVAALAHHLVQAAGGQSGKLFQGLTNEWQIGINPRRSLQFAAGQTGLRQDAADRAGMHVQLPSNGAGAPFFDVVITKDSGFKVRGYGHDGFLYGQRA